MSAKSPVTEFDMLL